MTECVYVNGWIKTTTTTTKQNKNKKTNKTVTYTEISSKMVNPRDIAGNVERRRIR